LDQEGSRSCGQREDWEDTQEDVGEQKEFSLEVLYKPGGNITDPYAIAKEVSDTFGGSWFNQTDDERQRGKEIRTTMSKPLEEGFMDIIGSESIPPGVVCRVYEGMKTKEVGVECELDSKHLLHYVPSFEEFKGAIEILNPRSAGGPSGLTYLLVQYWPDEVKKIVYEDLRKCWINKTPSKQWGLKFLQTIPKDKEDPGLEDLRPLMLVEVTRKIWVGLIMDKIADFWNRWGLIDQAQHD